MPYGLGAHPSPPDARDWPISQLGPMPATAALPLVFTARPLGPIYDQGATPQCVAYATAGLKSHEELTDNNPHLPHWRQADFYARCKQVDGIAGDGTTGRAAMQVLRASGYPADEDPTGAHFVISAYYAVPTDFDSLCAAVAAFGVIIIGMPWYPNWDFAPGSSLIRPNGILPEPSGNPVGGHELRVVGFDRRKLVGWPDPGFLILANSWGPTWGNGRGYAYLPARFTSMLWEAWKAVDVRGDNPGGGGQGARAL
jgi:hypothetical protein